MQGDLYRAQGVTLPAHGTDGLTSPPKDGTLEQLLYMPDLTPPGIEPVAFRRESSVLTTRPPNLLVATEPPS